MSETATTETLAYERRATPWLVRLVAALVIVLAGTAVILNERLDDKERPQLSRCASAAEAAIDGAEDRLTALAHYIAPEVDPPRTRSARGLYALLSEDASTSLPTVEGARAKCLKVDVWSLHRSTRRARDGYVALMAAELDRLDRVVADGTAYYDGYDEIRRLRAAAEDAFGH